MYIHQRKDWPAFVWDREKLLESLAVVTHNQGRLLGRMYDLGFSLKAEATLQAMTLEVLKSNEIEGENLDINQVRSSIARHLGMDVAGLVPTDRNVDGVVEMMLDATQNYQVDLTPERLFGWHKLLFPFGHNSKNKMIVGAWRNNTMNDPMQVVSGAMGKEKVHFEAPASELLEEEMNDFLNWFNTSSQDHGLIKAAVAHLWFVTIHPFDDGNGRIARSIADMMLARADGTHQRFYSMSAQIKIERKDYYDLLEKTQKGTLDITEWILWFLKCLDSALLAANEITERVIKKSLYWEWLGTKSLTDRQHLMVNKLLDGFDGKLTSSKWAKIAKCSQDTALRDIQDLMEKRVLEKETSGGRSTNYRLAVINSF